ncbi:DNA-binding domain-containing protein, partial [Bacteroides fragilis]|uniref:DNA-binding domain-containing protein n=1 Tax=Bacteroides fragilis TaxID=817 RepID=UPI0039B49F61
MKTELKGWLADNTVTTDNKEDKILVLESAGNLTLSDVLDEMKKEDTGLRAETLGEFYQFNLSSCIRQQNSLTAQFVS